MTFPYDFGFVPRTEADDGDPIDVLVLMDERAFPGCVLECRPKRGPSSLAAGWVGGMRRTTTLSFLFFADLRFTSRVYITEASFGPLYLPNTLMSLFHFLRLTLLAHI